MSASLTDIHTIEQFLAGRLRPDERLVFEARMLTQPALQRNVILQQKIQAAAVAFGRHQLKQQLKAVHQNLFSHPRKRLWQQRILQYFNQ